MNEEQKNKFWTLIDELYDRTKSGSSYYQEITVKGEKILELFQGVILDQESDINNLKNQLQSKDNHISELQENIYFMENTIKTLQNHNKKLEKRSNLDEIKNIVFA